MAISAGNAVLPITPQIVKSFSRDIVNQMAGPAVRGSEKAGREHGRRFGHSFSGGLRAGVGPVRGILRGFGPGLAAAFGGAAIVAGIKSVTDEAREAAIVGAQTAAVLKSTGGAARVSARQVGDLANALSLKSGVDDEVIQTSENLLLTFRGVRNEAGKGNDIFNQSSAAIVDMTASMHGGQVTAQGLKASTIQVGKALNDPIKGMTALSRVGVTFNDQQREQIKTLVESGDKLGAQKIILAELSKEFGGSAAASADAGKRFGVFVGNLKEQIGTALLPILNRFLGFLVDKLPGALATAGRALSLVKFAAQAVFDTFLHGRGSGYLDAFGPGAAKVLEGFGVALRGVWEWIKRTATVLAGVLGPALRSIGDAIAPAAAAFAHALLPGLKSLWHVVQAQVLPALKLLAQIVGVVLYAALRYVLPLILRLAGPVLGFLFKQLGQTIQWIANVIRFIGRLGAWFLRWITGTKTTGAAVAELGRRVGVFAANMTKQWQAVVRQVSGALGFLKRTTVAVLSFMIRMWLRWAGSIIDAAASAMGWVPGIGPKLRRAQAQFHEFAAGVNRALDKIRDENVKVTARAGVTWTAEAAHFRLAAGRMATGGKITRGTGPTADDVPIWASKNETVVSAADSADPWFRRWAAERHIPGYARGGLIPSASIRSDIGTGQLQRMTTGLAKGLSRAVGTALTKAIAASQILTGGSGAGFGSGSWMRAIRELRREHVPYSIVSTFRRGAVTHASGRQSFHALNRAVDLDGGHDKMRIWRALTDTNPTELIYSRARLYKSRSGWHPISRLDPITRGDHYSHVHAAYALGGRVFDRGGTLDPGLNLVANRTGRPEPLVPAGDEIDYRRLGQEVARALTGVQLVVKPENLVTGLRAHKRTLGGQALGLS